MWWSRVQEASIDNFYLRFDEVIWSLECKEGQKERRELCCRRRGKWNEMKWKLSLDNLSKNIYKEVIGFILWSKWVYQDFGSNEMMISKEWRCPNLISLIQGVQDHQVSKITINPPHSRRLTTRGLFSISTLFG